MHPGLAHLFRQLRELRESAGMSPAEVEEELVLGPGWVARFESGEVEPSVGTLAALVAQYGSDLSTFFAEVDLGSTDAVLDRHLSASVVAGNLSLHFPMGAHTAEVILRNATMAQYADVMLTLRDELAQGRKREAVAACFMRAVQTWPKENPSDLWYFLVSHAYQDNYNHPAIEGSKDWSQSWKRAGGWALEAIILEHYNPFLRRHGIRLLMPDNERKKELLSAMGVIDIAGSQKSDVLVVGTRGNRQEAFGVVHVKASFAERRTDDVPLSQQLISKGYASPLVTMDCKASPAPRPINRGELGAVQSPDGKASAKRLDIEKDRKFDACFSYNSNTKGTPEGQAASARIYVNNFANPNDSFSRYLRRKWRDRQGLE